jgi:hypothetical protein
VYLAAKAGWDYLVVDGVNIPTERVAAGYTQKQHWYSGKHKRHGGAVQTVAAPDGELLWVSGVLPGAPSTSNGLPAGRELPLEFGENCQ